MAEQIVDLCREFVTQNADSVGHLGEVDAVDTLAQRFGAHLVSIGWDAGEEHFHIDVLRVVRDELRRHRG